MRRLSLASRWKYESSKMTSTFWRYLRTFELDDDPETVRLNYIFLPKAGLGRPPASEDDFEFACYGGEDKSKRFGHEVRRRITMDLLPALRDAEGDLANWSRSPLRPLVESAFGKVNVEELASIKTAIEAATQELAAFESVEELEENIRVLFEFMSGPKQNIELRLGFGATDVYKLIRNIRLLIDNGRRGINDAKSWVG